MAINFYICQGDLEPDLLIYVTGNGVAKDISLATAYQMRWRKPDGTFSLVDLAAEDLGAGVLRYTWVAGDTDVVGTHLGQVVMTIAGEPESFPNDGTYIEWAVTRPLQ